MARELGDFLPLDSDTGKGRLVREDENDASDDEDDDEKRRIVFSVKEKSQRQKIAEEIGKMRRKMAVNFRFMLGLLGSSISDCNHVGNDFELLLMNFDSLEEDSDNLQSLAILLFPPLSYLHQIQSSGRLLLFLFCILLHIFSCIPWSVYS